MKSTLIHAAGWYGMLAILLAFILVSFELVGPTDLSYQLLNLTGGLGLAAETFTKKAFPATILNVVFAAVALIALIKMALS